MSRSFTSFAVAAVAALALATMAQAASSFDAVRPVLEQLRARLEAMRDQSLDMSSSVDRAGLTVDELARNQNKRQVDPGKVVALKAGLEKLGSDAAVLRKDALYKVQQLRGYQRKLRQSFPTRRSEVESYYRQVDQLRVATQKFCRRVEAEAPRRARDLDRMLREGFGNYLADGAIQPARTSTTPPAPRATPETSVDYGDETPAPAATPLKRAPTSNAGDAELDRFFGGSDEETASARGTLGDQGSAAKPRPSLPPLMVDEGEGEQPSGDDEGDGRPAPTAAPRATPATKPSAAPTPQGTPAPTPDATPASTPAATPAATPASETKTPATTKSNDEDIDGFLDESRAPAPPARTQLVEAARARRAQLFSDRIAEEFRREGIEDRVAAPPARDPRGVAAEGPRNDFARRLEEEVRHGVPGSEDIFPAPCEDAPAAGTAAEAARAESGRVQQLLAELRSVRADRPKAR